MNKKFKLSYTVVLAILCVLLIIAFSIVNKNFFTYSYIMDMIKLTTEIGIMALPFTLLIIMGCTDFSACTILSMSACLGGIIAGYTKNPLLGLIVSLATGALCGAFNGFLVAYLELPPLITTLATMYLYKGIAEGMTLASGYGTNVAATKIAIFLGSGSVFKIPTQIYLLAIIAVILHIVLSKTIYGRTLYAIGLNAYATEYAGINVRKTKIFTYVLAGTVFATAGQVLMGRFSTMQYDSADSYLMQIITACVLGGINMSGGRGNIGGTLLGVAVIGILKGGMNAALIPQTQQKIILGIVLLVSLVVFQLIAEHDLKVKGEARMKASAEEYASRQAEKAAENR